MDMGLILAGIGLLGALVGGIWLIVCAFQKSIVWGLCYMFVPFACLVYIILDFRKAWKPFAIHTVSILVVFGGLVLSPTMQDAFSKAQAEAKAQMDEQAQASRRLEGAGASEGLKK